jgi:hypothetical protein
MVENDENDNVGRFDINSKFMRVFLVLVAVVLIFAGPTYVTYLFFNVFNVNYVASIALGTVLFIAGLFLMWFLIRKKIIV